MRISFFPRRLPPTPSRARALAAAEHIVWPGFSPPSRFKEALIPTEDHRFESPFGPGIDPVGVLESAERGPVVACRVHMDVVPIHENEAHAHRPCREAFVSTHPSVTRARGRNVHAAVRLAAAKTPSGLCEQTGGRVKFVFQLAEDGGRG